eukprot:CAMPEP_0181496828 /NCGR_PEP_ID=MMETSP1110-20121109/53205_1 /TAXON_ID=174948 /ORGANISM="Symbiodinium sp., Strain CCMP421" /LENGTH=129 /DNA_ID=CAMNT_0023624717 /DNA_START=52 /DNA_END=439 /DNA_ORIENTATION=-
MTCAKISVVSKRFQLRSGPVRNSQPATAKRSDSSTANTNAKNISLMAKAGGIERLHVSASCWVCMPMEIALAKIMAPIKPLNSGDSTTAASLDAAGAAALSKLAKFFVRWGGASGSQLSGVAVPLMQGL